MLDLPQHPGSDAIEGHARPGNRSMLAAVCVLLVVALALGASRSPGLFVSTPGTLGGTDVAAAKASSVQVVRGVRAPARINPTPTYFASFPTQMITISALLSLDAPVIRAEKRPPGETLRIESLCLPPPLVDAERRALLA